MVELNLNGFLMDLTGQLKGFFGKEGKEKIIMEEVTEEGNTINCHFLSISSLSPSVSLFPLHLSSLIEYFIEKKPEHGRGK